MGLAESARELSRIILQAPATCKVAAIGYRIWGRAPATHSPDAHLRASESCLGGVDGADILSRIGQCLGAFWGVAPATLHPRGTSATC